MSRVLYSVLMMLSISLSSFAQNNLKLAAQCSHIDPSFQTTGKIELTITGGQPPYQVSWNEQFRDSITRHNLYEGEYQVRVTDASGNNSFLTSAIRYKQLWKRRDTSFAGADIVVSGISANHLKAGNNGAIYYVVPEDRPEIQFGLLKDTLISGMADHGFQLKAQRIYICSSRQVRGYFGKIKKGDTLAVARVNDKLTWSLNRKRLYSEPADTARFRVFVKYKGTTPDLLSDFSIPLKVRFKPVDNVCSAELSGRIEAVISGGEGPYYLRYYKGYETVASSQVDNRALDAGPYSALIEDRKGEQVKSTVDIGYKPLFPLYEQSSFLFLDSISSLRKNSPDGWCDSRISLKNSFTSDISWLELSIPDTNSKCFVGIQSSVPEHGCSGIYFSGGKFLFVSIDSDGLFNKIPLEGLEPGKLMRLEIQDSNFRIRNDSGGVITELPIVLTEGHSYSFHLFSEGIEIKNIRTSNPCN